MARNNTMVMNRFCNNNIRKPPRQEALDILRQYSNIKIAKLYDANMGVQESILTLMPTFEYPDWSYMTIGEFLQYVA